MSDLNATLKSERDKLSKASTNLAKKIADAEAQLEALKTEAQTTTDEITRIDDFLRKTPKASKGSPKKSKAKAKAKAKAKTPTNPKVSESRKAVADGRLPPLKLRLLEVMKGSKGMKIPDIVKALDEKNWTPNSKKVGTYMSLMLGSHEDLFERVTRGVYKIRDEAVEGKTKVNASKVNGKASKAKSNSKAKTKAKADTQGKDEPSSDAVDEKLSDLGNSVADNPFA